ncbi:DUF6557 family protein [Cohnella sp. WQ 127256]|uniref:DUF6557 family protein n=1 Tax=Cohnella sp. WQ 127256 TaxID=2938790 RepID=UPI0021187D04|nr:DUF6557 family protein [Cohnella sp. WQ 127256]
MTTFKDVLHKVDFDKVWDQYIYNYPDSIDQKNYLRSIFNDLLEIDAINNEENMIIYIDKQESKQSPELPINNGEEIEEFRVHGKNNSTEWSGYWDLSASKWPEWLGYFIDNNVLKRFRYEQIVALCLCEMTWFGYSEIDIANKLNNLGNEEE